MQTVTRSADIVMAGTFAAWRLGTLQARALPLARELHAHGVRCAIVTVPWDMPAEGGVIDAASTATLYNTRAPRTATFPLAVYEQMRHIQLLNPGAVHVFKPKGYGGLTGRLLAATFPLIVDADDWEGDGGWNQAGGYSAVQRRLFDWQERDLLKRADAVTAASLLLARRASQLRAGRPLRTAWIPNGLERRWAAKLSAARDVASATDATPNTISIVLYSRFAEFPEDWLPRFIAALSARLPAGISCRFVVAGATELSDVGWSNIMLQQMGYVARDMIPFVLAQATIAVYPYADSLISRSKNSVKLLELMAAGCAVVASNVGDVRAVAGDTALIVDQQDPEAFAAATVALAGDPARMQILSTLARERALTTFSLPTIAGRLNEVYRDFEVITT